MTDIKELIDRIFPGARERYEAMSEDERERNEVGIIEKVVARNNLLEKNLSSMERKYHYREEFWRMVPDDVTIIYGYDAHSLADMEWNCVDNRE